MTLKSGDQDPGTRRHIEDEERTKRAFTTSAGSAARMWAVLQTVKQAQRRAIAEECLNSQVHEGAGSHRVPGVFESAA